jgi:hypothetical protein
MPFPFRPAALAIAALVLATGSITGCTSDSGSTEDFCAQVKKVPSLEAVLSRFSEADRDVLQGRIDKARAAYQDLADAAPAEIDEETDQVVSLVDAVLDAVEQHPNDPAKASAQLRKAMADHKAVEADRAKVAAYAQRHCDVQLDATLSNQPASTSTTTTTGDGAATSSSTTEAGG